MGTPAKTSKTKGGTAKPKKEKKVKDPNAPKVSRNSLITTIDSVIKPATLKSAPDPPTFPLPLPLPLADRYKKYFFVLIALE